MIRTNVTTDEIGAALQKLQAGYGDLTSLMQSIGEKMLKSTEANFKDGSGPDGTAWAAKSAATLASYERRKAKRKINRFSTRPLIMTGTLSRTIAYEARSDAVDWGSNEIQAAVMQFGAKKGEFGTASNGSSIPWGTIPARPYLGLGEKDETAIMTLIDGYLDGLTAD